MSTATRTPPSKTPGYQRMVWRKRGYGTWQPFVDATPVRAHLIELQASGLGRRRIAELAGLHRSTVSAIMYGRDGRPPNPRIRPATAAKILTITPGIGRYLVPAAGTIRRIQALMTIGWPQSYLGQRLGVTNGRVHDLLGRTKVLATTAQTIAGLYAELHNQNPADHGVKRHAITLVSNYAAAQGWPGPDYWEDVDRIDDASYVVIEETPRYKELGENGLWLEGQGLTREQAAERLKVTRDYLDQSIRRYRAALAEQAVAS